MANWIPLVILQMMVHISISLKFVTHPDADLNMEQKIIKHGYPVEIYEVVTEDDYILTLHRVPHGRHRTNKTNRSPVLLIHGMGAQAEYFMVLGRQSLIYYLADKGFDVWILNARGTIYSRKHKYFDFEKDSRYWLFSYHEIGVYDIPANIDFIVNKTNQKVFVIGHSQGNTCYFVMATEKPEYNDKVKISAVYAPSILLKYMDYPLAAVFSYFVEVFEMVYEFLGMGAVVPINDYTPVLVKLLCSETTFFMRFCMHVLAVIGSHESHLIDKVNPEEYSIHQVLGLYKLVHREPKLWMGAISKPGEDKVSLSGCRHLLDAPEGRQKWICSIQAIIPLVFSIPPAVIAARQLFHYMQGIKSGIFRQYDYGEVDNLVKYRAKTPPEYNLTNSVAPVAIFYAARDEVTSIMGAEETVKVLPNVIFYHKVPYKFFNHIDFLFASNASSLVYKRTVQLFKDFDNGKIKSKSRK